MLGSLRLVHGCHLAFVQGACDNLIEMPKRHAYSVDFKLKAIRFLRSKGGNVSLTAKEFKVDRKRIREWRRKYVQLLLQGEGKTKTKRKLHHGRQPYSEQVDNAVFEFLEEERASGHAVSNEALSRFARNYANRHDLHDFKASSGWLKRWKMRFNVGIRRGTNASQFVPADYKEKILAFRRGVRELRKHHDYTPYNIANMDQTMVR